MKVVLFTFKYDTFAPTILMTTEMHEIYSMSQVSKGFSMFGPQPARGILIIKKISFQLLGHLLPLKILRDGTYRHIKHI